METLETPGRVLLLEHDRTIRDALKRVLPNVEVVVASNEKAALEAMRKSAREQPDLVLLDLQLPNLDGLEFMKQLRVAEATAQVPVVMLTADRTAAARWSALNLAATAALAVADISLLPQYAERFAVVCNMLRSFRETYAQAFSPAIRNDSELTEQERKVLSTIGYPLSAPLDSTPLAIHAARYDQLVATSLTTAQAAKKLRVNQSRIRQQLTGNPPELYGIRHQSEWRLPKFQFRAKGQGLVPNIKPVIRQLPSKLDPVAVDTWFRTPNVDLVQDGKLLSPLDWLTSGLDGKRVALLAADL